MKALGIDVGGTNLKIGVAKSDGSLLFNESMPTIKSPAGLTNQIHEQIKKITALHSDLEGIGVGWPGPVDETNGIVFATPNLVGFDHFHLKSMIEKMTSLPVQIENDAKCAGLAEIQFGKGHSKENFILLTFGTGIGGAIIANSKLLRGKSGGAGEIGHLTLFPDGLPCNCGKQGCFELYCSSVALEKKLGIKAKDFFAQAKQDNINPAHRELFDEYTHHLAIGVGNLVNLFDPQAIVFTGGFFRSDSDVILKPLKNKIKNQCFPALQKNLTLMASSLQNQGGLLGAASLIFHKFKRI